MTWRVSFDTKCDVYSCGCHLSFWMPCSNCNNLLICLQWSVYSFSHKIWQIWGYMSTPEEPLCHVKANIHQVSMFLLDDTFLCMMGLYMLLTSRLNICIHCPRCQQHSWIHCNDQLLISCLSYSLVLRVPH